MITATLCNFRTQLPNFTWVKINLSNKIKWINNVMIFQAILPPRPKRVVASNAGASTAGFLGAGAAAVTAALK